MRLVHPVEERKAVRLDSLSNISDRARISRIPRDVEVGEERPKSCPDRAIRFLHEVREVALPKQDKD